MSSGERPAAFEASRIACPKARASSARARGSFARFAMMTSAIGSGTNAARGIDRSDGGGS